MLKVSKGEPVMLWDILITLFIAGAALGSTLLTKG